MRARLTRARAALSLLAATLVVAVTAGCAYFNTFYSAKKNFADAELQIQTLPDPEVRAPAGAATLYDKAIQGSTKVLREYPDSKWVDDAVLLIGRSMLGKGDYEEARLKFAELGLNFPNSPLLDEATFYSGVAAERDRRRGEAAAFYDSLLATYPKSKLRDDALLRRANLYLLARETRLAEPSLRELSTREGKMGYDAGLKLAEALFLERRYADARVEFARVAERAPTEKLRMDARLRMGDCDEAMSNYDAAAETYLRLLRDSRTSDDQARARLRYASALGLAGKVDAGLAELANVIEDQPRTPWAAEAAFRTGYLQEVIRDDFAAARTAYDAVATQQPGSPFVAQAASRRGNLDRLESFRSAQGDSVGSDAAAEAVFQSAELLLFQLGKPEQALEEYARLEKEHPESPLAPRAAFARGWVKARRLGNVEGARAEFEALVARWPDAPIAARARRLLANPADSTFAGEGLPPTSVHFPLIPGNPPYVPPAPVVALVARSSPRPGAPGAAPITASSAADSAAAAVRAAVSAARRESIAAARRIQP